MKRIAFLAPFAAFSGAALAEAPAVTATVTEIGTYAAPVAAIGLAVLAGVLAVKGVKWFRRAL